MQSPHMLTGEEIREYIQALRAELARPKLSGTDRQIYTLSLAVWQLVAEMDEIRYTLRKFVQRDISAESTG